MRKGTSLKVTGALSDGAKLDLLAQDPSVVLTSGLESNGAGSLAAFTYNQEQGVAPTLKDGELFIDLTVKADKWVSDWSGLQTAINNATDGQIIGLSKSVYADGNGGGIRLWRGATTINSGAITGNTAKDGHGGGVYVGGATLNLYGGSITGNTAANEGGGIRIEQTGDGAVNIQGAPVVKDNTAKTGSDIFIRDKMVLTFNGKLTDGAELHVTPESLEKVFTSGFYSSHGNVDPQKYFIPDSEDFSVLMRDNEARVIASDWSRLQRQIDEAQSGATITLERNWRAADGDQTLVIPADKTLTIDLNGCALDRGLAEKAPWGTVISNSGTLTIRDSKGGGTIPTFTRRPGPPRPLKPARPPKRTA